MNEVIRALKERRSIRSYRTEQVREEDLQQILEAATYAPSGMGAQPVILVAVQDPATIARLSQLNAAVMGTKTDPFYGCLLYTSLALLMRMFMGTTYSVHVRYIQYMQKIAPCQGGKKGVSWWEREFLGQIFREQGHKVLPGGSQ